MREGGKTESMPIVRLRIDPVAMTWRLTCDDHAERARTFISRLMPPAGGNLESLTSSKKKVLIFDFKRQFPFKNKEELACMRVRMSGLTRARRHEFLNDAEVGRPDEVPAVAVSSLRTSPLVVIRRLRADDPVGHEAPSL
jgi:hypothetical protein